MSGRLASKTAFVTGAGNGIGAAIAAAFSAEGAAVAVTDIDAAAAERTASALAAAGGRTEHLVVDIADEESVRRGIAATVAAFGRLDLAVNNAGVPASAEDLTTLDAATWERTLRIDLTGMFFCLKHEILAMRGHPGSIVNIASGAGIAAIPRSPAYVTSKHGIVGLTKAAAVDYASAGVRVNALAPGMTRTAMLERVAAGTGMIAAHEALTPMRRLGTSAEIAAAAVWLASDEASYVTGVVLPVDGGRRA